MVLLSMDDRMDGTLTTRLPARNPPSVARRKPQKPGNAFDLEKVPNSFAANFPPKDETRDD